MLPGTMSKQAVIFDLFGTLVDEMDSWLAPTRAQMAEALSIPEPAFSEMWARTASARGTGRLGTIEASVRHICDALGRTPSPEAIGRAVAIRTEMTQRVLTPRPDAEETLGQLRDSGFKVGLVSNCSPEVPALLWSTSPAPYIDHAVFSSISGLTKPDPRIFRMACDGLGVAPEGCWYVGDGDSDELAGAKAVGMDAALVAMRYSGDGGVFRALHWDGPRIERLGQVLALV